MISLKRLGAALFVLGVAISAANAAGLTIESPSLRLAPSDPPRVDTPSQSVPIDMPDAPVTTLRFRTDERPISISDREDQPNLQTRMFEPEAAAVLRCRIDGESAGSIIVANVGSEPVMAGTTIKWQVRSSGERGFFSLGKDLSTGQSVRARDVLSGRAGDNGKCSAKAV
jgi:hypothetical protein